MNIFLVDYENVNVRGLNGTKFLKKKDKVYIFYGVKSKSIDIEIIDNLVKSKAYFKLFKLDKIAKNALDFQLVLFLGTRIKKYGNKSKYHIISNDNGYQSSIDFAKEHFNVHVDKSESIREAIKGKSPKLLLESNPKLELNTTTENKSITTSNENTPQITKKQKNVEREKIESLLKNNKKLKNKLLDSQLKQISSIFMDESKNTKDTLEMYIGKCIGLKKSNLVPVILKCCKDYIK